MPKKIKWGIISTGNIAHKFAEALQVVENSELVAVGSRNIESARKFASKFNIPNAYGSYEELVKDPDVDVVYIATPHNLHFQNTMMALENNKHVLCEKPLGVNSKEVNIMIEKAKEKKLFFMEALWSRFLPNIIKAKDLVESGVIGKVKLLAVSFTFKVPFNPEARHYNLDLCGGTVLDTGIYNVFLTQLFLGKPKSFIASAGLSKLGGDNSCSVTFNYDDDIMAVTYTSFLVNTPIVAEIHGEKGKIILEDRWFCPSKIKLVLDEGKEEIFDFDIKCNGYELEAIEVANCILAGKTESDLWSWNDSLQLIDMLDAIRKECGIVYPKHDL